MREVFFARSAKRFVVDTARGEANIPVGAAYDFIRVYVILTVILPKANIAYFEHSPHSDCFTSATRTS